MLEREIVVRIRLPKLPRKRWLLGGVVCALFMSAIVYAMVPNTFISGDPLSATKVMANFTNLDGRVGTLEAKDGWTDVATFGAGWSNFGNGYANAGYRRSSDGVVYLRGLVKGGANASTIFMLPTGYHPSGLQRFIAATRQVPTSSTSRPLASSPSLRSPTTTSGSRSMGSRSSPPTAVDGALVSL